MSTEITYNPNERKERIRKWIKALRSGDYRQGKNNLRVIDSGEFVISDGKEAFRYSLSYCCLGVACESSKKGKWLEDRLAEYVTKPRDEICPDICDGYLPNSLANYYELDIDQQTTLAQMNDRGDSFEKIADYIEENYL